MYKIVHFLKGAWGWRQIKPFLKFDMFANNKLLALFINLVPMVKSIEQKSVQTPAKCWQVAFGAFAPVLRAVPLMIGSLRVDLNTRSEQGLSDCSTLTQ